MTWLKLKFGMRVVRSCPLLITTVVIFSAFANASQAAPMATAMNGAIPGFGDESMPFAVSNVDIGETMGTWTLTAGSDPFGGNVSKLNNGIKYVANGSGETTEAFSPSNGSIATLTFSEPVDISSIQSLTGFSAARVQQDFSVEYSNNGVDFDPLFAVDGTLPNNINAGNVEVLVSITDSDPFLATNVQALQFTFNDTGTFGVSVYREIDVFGQVHQAAVPETTSIAIWSLLAFVGMSYGVLRRRRKNA